MIVWLAVPAVVAAVALLVAVARRPSLAAPIYLGSMPFLAGIDRGRILPLLRPTELAQLALTGAAWTGMVVIHLRRRGPWSERSAVLALRPRLTRLDVALLVLAVCGSLVPMARLGLVGIWPGGHGPEQITTEDLLACIPLWKVFLLYLLFRTTVRTGCDAYHVLVVTLAAASTVAVVALLQTLNLFGVQRLLGTLWAPYGSAEDLNNVRGTTTLAGAIATAGYLTFNLGLAVSAWLRGQLSRRWAVPLVLLLALGLLGTGQISGLVGGLVVTGVVAAQTGHLRRVAIATAVAVPLAAIPLAPVIRARLQSLGAGGVPESWLFRLYNLRTYYWSQLREYRWVLGTRPNTIIDAPERWRTLIFVESGHTWLLLVGGLPLLAAFGAFLVVAFQSLRAASRMTTTPFSTFATAASAGVVGLAVLMVFDTHLTMRGSSDMIFALIGVALAPFGSRFLPWPVPA